LNNTIPGRYAFRQNKPAIPWPKDKGSSFGLDLNLLLFLPLFFGRLLPEQDAVFWPFMAFFGSRETIVLPEETTIRYSACDRERALDF
jgi:hypothetical protein